jgi:hypothetical protein
MKFFYAIAILVQLVLAFLSGNRNKTSYILHLLGSLLDCGIVSVENKKNSDLVIRFRKSKAETGSDKYSFLLER